MAPLLATGETVEVLGMKIVETDRGSLMVLGHDREPVRTISASQQIGDDVTALECHHCGIRLSREEFGVLGDEDEGALLERRANHDQPYALGRH